MEIKLRGKLYRLESIPDYTQCWYHCQLVNFCNKSCDICNIFEVNEDRDQYFESYELSTITQETRQQFETAKEVLEESI